jgi:AcrR family transcriptional regulator
MDANSTPGAAPKTSGWRGSEEVWLEAAKEALLDGGVDAVRIQPLATRLQLSRTSFYWFFKDRKALLDALLQRWEDSNTAAVVAATEAYADTIAEAVLNLISAFLDNSAFEPRFDFAIRSWAHQDADVMARVNDADERRLASIRGMFDRFGFAPQEADVRARTVYLVQIGYISMQVQESLATRITRIPAYVKTYSGQAPTDRELARFYARHDFQPGDSMK